MLINGALALFMSLAIGYVLCILANKQKKGLLQTVGYMLGTAIIAMSLLYSALDSREMTYGKGKAWRGCKDMKGNTGVFMKGIVK